MKTLLNIATRIALPCLAIVGAIYAIYYSVWAQDVMPADGHLTPTSASASSTTGDSGTVLAGPGIVEPAGEAIEVAPPLPGVVEYVISQDRVNTVVKKGEELLRLDSKELKARLEVGKAQLASAQAELNRQKSMPRAEDLAPLVAKAREAKIAVNKSKSDYDRYVQAGSAVEGVTRDEKQFAHEAAQAQWEWAVAEWNKVKAGAWGPDIALAEAAVKLAEAQVAQTQTDLDRLIVRCTADLTLWKVDVRPQEYIGLAPGKTIIMLGDANKHLRVYIDEHDATRFLDALQAPGAPGKKAKARLPRREEPFPLVYVRHEPVIVPKPILTGEQTERVDVRVLPVIYRFENADDQNKVFVGQQLDVYIDER
jgi:hypothetical protein